MTEQRKPLSPPSGWTADEWARMFPIYPLPRRTLRQSLSDGWRRFRRRVAAIVYPEEF